MTELLAQISARDAAILTWLALGVGFFIWSDLRKGGGGTSTLDLIRAALAPRLVVIYLLVAAWQLAIIFAAARIGLWDPSILKDTIVLIAVGTVVCGFRALDMMKGKKTWRDEVRALVRLAVIIQLVSNLETFPFVVEMLLVPIALLLGGMQAVAAHDDKHTSLRRPLDVTITLLGLAILGWSVFRLATTLNSTEWDTVGKQFALAFWLPAALLPAIYLAALVMQYGMTFTVMKMVKPQSVSARAQVLAHHRWNLRRLNDFALDRGCVRECARTKDRSERTALLKGVAHSANR